MSERQAMGLIGMVVIGVIVIAALRLLTGCVSWQDTSRRSLDAISRSAQLAVKAVDVACDRKRDGCIAASDRTCAALQRCHLAEREVNKGAVAAQVAVLVGLAAVDVGDKPSVAKALGRAVRLMEPVKTALSAYGVVLP